MTNHTPGPWTLEIDTHQAAYQWYDAAISVGSPMQGGYRTLARIPQAEHAYDEQESARVEADARLIAAAPDLKASLSYALEVLERFAEDTCECEPCPECGLSPAECTKTECSQTCQCGDCLYCRAAQALEGGQAAIDKAKGSAVSPGCQACGEPHGVSVPCGFARSQP